MAWVDTMSQRLAHTEWSHRPRRNRIAWAAVLTAEMALVLVLPAWLLDHIMDDTWAVWTTAVIVAVWFMAFVWTVALDPHKGFKLGLYLIPVMAFVAPIGVAAAAALLSS